MLDLANMTQDKWNALTPAQRKAVQDRSGLHPQLAGLEGHKVRVEPKREYGRSTFRVGITTGWRPCHLAMRAGAMGSSDTINPAETFTTVRVLA